MLSSITPLGERGRHNRWSVTVGIYVAASTVGGALVGAAAGAVGAAVAHLWRPAFSETLILIALASIGAAAFDLRRNRHRMPGVRRQVNEEWLSRYRSWVYALAFGLQLGIGLVTIVASASLYLTVVIAVVSASIAGGAAIGGIFGLCRAIPILATRDLATPIRLQRFHRRLHELHHAARTTTITVELAVMAVAAGLAAGSVR